MSPTPDPADEEKRQRDEEAADSRHAASTTAARGDVAENIIGEELDKESGVAAGEAATPAGAKAELTEATDDDSPPVSTAAPPTARAEENVQHKVARSAGIVSLAVMGSRVLGLVREQVFAAYFGAGFLNDAFQVGFRIPNTLRDLFAEGALSVAFVKTFTDYSVKRSEEEAWRLASLVLNALAIVLSAITVVGIVFSPQIVSYIAADFSPEKIDYATQLTRIMFPFILLVALAAVAMGVLNTKGHFGVPASASTLFNVGSIVGGLGFAYWLSGGSWTSPHDPRALPDEPAMRAMTGMAIGTLIGGGLQFLIQVPSLRRVGFRFRPAVSFSDPGVRQVMRLMGPAVVGTAAVQINVLVNTFFASGIPGGQSWLGYAFRLMQLPIGVFGVAIGTATLPTISKLATQGDIPRFRTTLSSSLGLVFLLTIPSACGLVVLGRPIISLIYERGAFTSSTTDMVAWALAAYSVGLAGYAAIRVLSPAFYALNDARTPMLVSLASILLNIFASYFFKNWFAQIGVTPETPSGYAHAGLALSTSCVALVNFFALALLMRRRIRRLEGRRIFSSFVRITAASAALSAASYFSYVLLVRLLGARGFVPRLIETFVPIAVGGAVFFVAARLLRVEELNQAVNALAGRFVRRRTKTA